jgi:hypothetical protein
MPTRNQMYVTKAVSHRTGLLDQEKILDEAAIDRYEFIRDAYLLQRTSLVYDGNPPREKYDDEENNINKNVPIPSTPSSQRDDIPSVRPASSTPVQLASASTEPQQYAADRPSVHKIWVAQRTGIR